MKITEAIGPAFYECFWDIQEGRHTFYDLYGGRGSAKSSFVSIMIVLGVMQDQNAGAVVFRKVANTLRDSVYSQIGWAIDILGVTDLWRPCSSPLKYIYKPTGQEIVFYGLDDPKKLKSIKCKHGYFKFLWYEELDEFSGEEEIRSTQQSVLRGGTKYVVFKTFNPPVSNNNWANMYVCETNERAYRLKTNYLQTPPSWLGEEFLLEADHLRQVNPRAYQHEYLGIPVGTGRNVFSNLDIRPITDEEIQTMGTFLCGLDWGYYPDPLSIVYFSYDPRSEEIFLLDEVYEWRWSNARAAEEIHARGWEKLEIICDSAEPKSIQDLRDAGLFARPAIKGPGSVDYGMKWLQTRKIVIDPARTPHAYEEFTKYEFDTTPKGEIITSYPDHDNHTIDALRYGTQRFNQRRGHSA